MLRLKIVVLLSLTLVFLTSCSEDKRTNTPAMQKYPTQIGTFFDRTIDINETDYQNSIFTIKSEMNGTQGIAIYLGEFEGHKLFMTNKHIVDQELDECDDKIALVDIKREIYLGCKGFIYSFENLDISIISMDFVLSSNSNYKFKPVVLSTYTLEQNSPLVLRTIDDELKAIVSDRGEDCFQLDTNPRLITDPDPDAIEEIYTWSIPMGCDALSGDSGAPVYAKNSGAVYGILWGGKLNKNFKPSSHVKVEVAKQNESLWTEYNFMIPSLTLLKELSANLKQSDVKSEEHKSLLSLLNHYDF